MNETNKAFISLNKPDIFLEYKQLPTPNDLNIELIRKKEVTAQR